MNKISVFLVDDHQLFREGLRLLLSNITGIGEIYEASNGQQFLDALENTQPDIVFMDIEMPVVNVIDTTLKAVKQFPDIRIIALSMYGDEDYLTRMINAGARGFIMKNSGISEVEDAIKSLLTDKNYFSPDVISGLLSKLGKPKKSVQPADLSAREIEVMQYICKGYSNQEIANALFLSKRTIDKHRENLLFKTRSKNTAELVMFALRSGIIELD